MHEKPGKPFQFGLATMFWLVLIAAVVCGLWLMARSDPDGVWGALSMVALAQLVIVVAFWLMSDAPENR